MDIVLSGGGYEAVVTDAGGGLRSVTREGRRIVAGNAPDEVVSGARGQVLVPWPNRIRDGAYEYAGTTRQLALTEPKRHNASHGLVRWTRWQVAASTGTTATLTYALVGQSGYPWALDVSAEYAVSADGLAVTIAATNRSDTPAPFAAGMHPYLDVGCHLDDAALTLPARTHQLADDRLLPTATEQTEPFVARPLRGVALDDAFTDLERDADGLAVVRLEGRWDVELWLDGSWPWVQAYSGDDLPADVRQALAVEPMSAPADAFNSGTDLVTLEPGQTWSGRFGIR